MLAKYPATYTDANGTVETSIMDDGEKLSMPVRGVTFEGCSPEVLEPIANADAGQLRMFRLARKHLTQFQLSWVMEVVVWDGENDLTASLSCEADISESTTNQGFNDSRLKLMLKVAGEEFESSGNSGLFDNELLEIQAFLPPPKLMKSCINCQFSDYSVYAQFSFGSMMCFRNVKEDYVKVRGKHEYLGVQDRYERFVQETFLCDQFERRIPGTGFRG